MKEIFKRFNARITANQQAFIKKKAKASKGAKTESDIHRELLDIAIALDKNKK